MSEVFYRTIISELGKMLGVPALAPNEAGTCELTLNKKKPIALVYDQKNQNFLIISPLDIPDDFPPKKLMSATWNSLHLDGPCVGFDEDNGTFIAWKTCPRAGLTAGRLLKSVQSFVHWNAQWEDWPHRRKG